MTSAARRTPRAARWSRVLLLAALLLGIVTMHTLGHPDDSPVGQDAATAHAVAHGAPAPAAHAVPDHSAPDGVLPAPAAPAPAAPAPADAAGTRVQGPDGGMAMDPMSVCLAVLLAGISLASVLALARTGAAATARPEARGVRAHGGPDPPTGRELLARLVVLRV
ncbi:hypothetical protein ACFWAR_23950 [Streptomyces sp. NPDC059917]|uniref:hypothetical protein n=1 Tax=Streptomyces sp. NPDC059917 TaxID=3347002 RepID=UPI00365FD534